MSNEIKNSDMPAMPLPNNVSGRPYVLSDYDIQNKRLAHGLTKREQFAMAAMQGILGHYGIGDVSHGGVAWDAVKCADALLAELDKDGGE